MIYLLHFFSPLVVVIVVVLVVLLVLVALVVVRHPDILSGMGMATKDPFGTDSSLFSNDMMQFRFEQVIE